MLEKKINSNIFWWDISKRLVNKNELAIYGIKCKFYKRLNNSNSKIK